MASQKLILGHVERNCTRSCWSGCHWCIPKISSWLTIMDLSPRTIGTSPSQHIIASTRSYQEVIRHCTVSPFDCLLLCCHIWCLMILVSVPILVVVAVCWLRIVLHQFAALCFALPRECRLWTRNTRDPWFEPWGEVSRGAQISPIHSSNSILVILILLKVHRVTNKVHQSLFYSTIVLTLLLVW